MIQLTKKQTRDLRVNGIIKFTWGDYELTLVRFEGWNGNFIKGLPKEYKSIEVIEWHKENDGRVFKAECRLLV